EELLSDPELTVEFGRQRQREVVLLAADRYDEMLEREELVRDLGAERSTGSSLDGACGPDARPGSPGRRRRSDRPLACLARGCPARHLGPGRR
ncbi:MAG: hypothetical protein ACR2QA_18135, partial [Solirubrobacteraceae bacterium]